jgi:alpha-D-xyloside xylohydrolase
MRDEVKPHWAARVARHTVEQGELVLRTVHKLEPKNNLNNYGITVRLSSPMKGVVRLRTTHLSGRRRRGPYFEVLPDSNQATSVTETDDALVYETGGLAVRIGKSPFTLELYSERGPLTEVRANNLGVMHVDGDRAHVMQRLTLPVGAHVYGLGERFGPLVRDGQSVTSWNEDPGTESELAYKNVPFFLTNCGFGVFVADPGRVEFEVMTERVSAVQISTPSHELDCYVIAGRTPKEVLERYTALSGRPALPPLWSFGLWLSTSFLTEYDERVVMSMIDGMKERDIPLSVYHFDCLWMKEHHWCDFIWDEAKFPEPGAMLSRIEARGVRSCVWINPYISEFSPLFAEGREHGYFLKNRAGDVYQSDFWQPQIAFVDFTNPAALAWYQSKLRALLAQGVACFKTDFGEKIPDDAVYADGSDPERMHNYYAFLYNQAVFSLLEAERGVGEAVVFARSATAGCQRFPVHWGGDSDATWTSMAETLRGGLSFGLSGGAFWSHDIGGFNQTASPALYKRWVAFGLLSSHSRLHGATSFRVPWAFDQEACDVLRHFTRLKLRLMPYLWACAVQARERGLPLMRAMLLEFPDDPTAAHLELQYMLGESLLVAPIFDATGGVRYYLPPGEWTDYETSERVQGGGFRAETGVGFFRIPLFVRQGTLLTLGKIDDRPDYDFGSGLRLELFALADGDEASAAVHAPNGEERARFTVTRRGSVLLFTGSGARDLTVFVRQSAALSVESGGTIQTQSARGVELIWPDPNESLRVQIVSQS